MVADGPPRRPGSSKRLSYQVLGRIPISGAGRHGPQAAVPGRLVELGEAGLVWVHTRLTRLPRQPLTWRETFTGGSLVHEGRAPSPKTMNNPSRDRRMDVVVLEAGRLHPGKL
jgi:hypothetical protein